MRRGWVLAALVLALAGCAGGAGGEQPPPPASSSTPAGPTPVGWADNLCAAILEFDDGATGVSVDSSSQAAAISSLTRYLDRMSTRVSAAMAKLRNLGPAPVPGGDDAARALVESLQTIAAVAERAKGKLTGVDPNDPVAAGAALKGVADDLQNLRAPVNPLEGMGTRYPELQAAARSAENCTAVTRARAGRSADPLTTTRPTAPASTPSSTTGPATTIPATTAPSATTPSATTGTFS